MATRYWVGGSGTWDASSTTNWSSTSGGTAGASAPTASDDVIVDSNSGTNPQIRLDSTQSCLSLTALVDCDFKTPTFGTVEIWVYGDVTLGSSAEFPSWSLTNFNTIDAIVLKASSTVSIQGAIRRRGLIIDAGAGTVQLAHPFSNSSTASNITLTSGTFDTNGYSVTTNTLTTSGASAKTLDISGSAVYLTGNFNMPAGITVNAAGSTITISVNNSFFGAGYTYGTLVVELGGSNDFLSITGSNTFDTITSINNGTDSGISFQSGTTTTVNTFSVTGISGKKTRIKTSTAGSKATLVKQTPWLVGTNSTATDCTGINLAAGDGIDYLDFVDIAAFPQLSSFLMMF